MPEGFKEIREKLKSIFVPENIAFSYAEVYIFFTCLTKTIHDTSGSSVMLWL
jgi:hypothetical protein